MSRDPIPLSVEDVSTFAKTLRAGLDQPPSHLEMLGLIARSAGYRNYQHMRARLASAPPSVVDEKAVQRAARHFDEAGDLARWPTRMRMQELCLWVIWSRLPAREVMTERSISARIHALCSFRDAAQIRRGLVEHALFTRASDGSEYLRVERAPTPDARALIARLSRRP